MKFTLIINLKFKKIRKIIIESLICLSIFSCTKEEENTVKNLNYTEVNLPSSIKTSSKSESIGSEVVEAQIITLDENENEIIGSIRFTLPTSDDESIIKLEISNNVFELTNLDPDFLLNAEQKGLLNITKSSCVASCREQFVNDDGEIDDENRREYNWCKVHCWAKVVVTAAATIIVAIIAA